MYKIEYTPNNYRGLLKSEIEQIAKILLNIINTNNLDLCLEVGTAQQRLKILSDDWFQEDCFHIHINNFKLKIFPTTRSLYYLARQLKIKFKEDK